MTSAPKILFLDVDGPMVPGRGRMLLGNSFLKFGWTFDPIAVSMLNFVYWACPDTYIVVGSHRLYDPRMRSPYEGVPDPHTKQFWVRLLEENGVAVPLHEDWHTPRMEFKGAYIPRPKHQEVTDWLNQHPEVTHFVTLEDDLNGGDNVSSSMRKKFHLVGEDYNNGLSWDDFKLMCHYMGLTLSHDKYAEWSMTA